MSAIDEIAAMLDLTKRRMNDAGINTPRVVLSPGDIDKLRSMIDGPSSHYLAPPDHPAELIIAGVGIYAARQRVS